MHIVCVCVCLIGLRLVMHSYVASMHISTEYAVCILRLVCILSGWEYYSPRVVLPARVCTTALLLESNKYTLD